MNKKEITYKSFILKGNVPKFITLANLTYFHPEMNYTERNKSTSNYKKQTHNDLIFKNIVTN
jgi:hypothetical protein